jgi:predicted metal-dependent HD superfamily phosphohydrolase
MVKTLKYSSPPRVVRRTPVASLQRWQAACEAIGARGDATLYRQLVAAWSGRSRHYHSLTHLEGCLRELEAARAEIVEPGMVELALWFHDAIYRTYRRDNEERSAQWAEQALCKAGATPETAARVSSYIRNTKHTAQAQTLSGDAAFVVDIDLAILGEKPEIYDQYEAQIRREYWWVARRRFARARIRILESFLARPSIYQTASFQHRYEERARENITRAIQALRRSL